MNLETSLASPDNLTENYPAPSYPRLAMDDLLQGIAAWRIWLMLSWQDIQLRYRRSTLGPFWITISMAISIYTMGFLYGHLFKMDLKTYYPFLAAGMLTWNLINLLIIETTNALIEADSYLKQMKLPYTIFIFRVVCRCFIVFSHNIIVIVPIILFFHVNLIALLFLVPGVLILAFNGFCYGIILSILGARFRDVTQIIVSLMQVAFFLTPVMWSPSILPARYQFIVELNPFAQFIELLRAPLTGSAPTAYAVTVTLALGVIGAFGAFYLLTRARHRIIYWL